MDELKYYDRIEAYAEERMTAENARQFEQELLTNAELKLEYDAYLITKEAAFVLGYERLKDEESSQKSTTVAKVRTINARWWLAAASFALILGFSLTWANQNYSNAALASNEFSATNVANTRTEQESTRLLQTKDAFESKEYNRVVDLVAAVSDSDSNYSIFNFIAGHANIGLENYSEATSNFLVAAADEDFIHSGNAQWNLALCYVLSGQSGMALDVLDEIVENPNADYYSNAVELRNKLNSFWRKLVL